MRTTRDRIQRRAGRVAVLISVGALALSSCGFGAPRFAGYDLPPEEQPYTLTVDYDNTNTTWQFSSSQVSADETPEGYVCTEQIHAAWMGNEIPPPCRPEPLIFLRYDAGVDLTNSVPAPGVHRFGVTAYRQAEDGPRIMGLKLWTSVDGGDTWRQSRVVRPQGRGRNGTQEFQVMVTYPAIRTTNGAVSIKAEAWDADGNRVSQQIDRAFDLTRR